MNKRIGWQHWPALKLTILVLLIIYGFQMDAEPWLQFIVKAYTTFLMLLCLISVAIRTIPTLIVRSVIKKLEEFKQTGDLEAYNKQLEEHRKPGWKKLFEAHEKLIKDYDSTDKHMPGWLDALMYSTCCIGLLFTHCHVAMIALGITFILDARLRSETDVLKETKSAFFMKEGGCS